MSARIFWSSMTSRHSPAGARHPRRRGHGVAIADECRRRARPARSPPDLILLDIWMPDTGRHQPAQAEWSDGRGPGPVR